MSAIAAAAFLFGPAWAEESPSVRVRLLAFYTAQRLALAAVESCRSQGYQVAAAVVDRSGNLQAFARDPLAGPHTIDVSQGKAYAAASFVVPTSEMADNEVLRFAPRALLIGGGVPIRIGGNLYGGVGVSGAPGRKNTGDIDEACAQAGIEAVREDLEFAEP
jgi:uncharacterized protein GlcG (DUF336 family)